MKPAIVGDHGLLQAPGGDPRACWAWATWVKHPQHDLRSTCFGITSGAVRDGCGVTVGERGVGKATCGDASCRVAAGGVRRW